MKHTCSSGNSYETCPGCIHDRKSAYGRRRNQYAAACKVCCTPVAVGDGWLYSDTRSSRSRSRRAGGGRWLKFVKCDRCHTLNAGSKADLPENKPAPLPKLGVGPLRAGRFVLGTYVANAYAGWKDTGVYLRLEDGAEELIAQLRPITSEPIGVGDSYGDGAPCFGGRVLTPAAEKELAMLGVLAADLFGVAMLDPRDAE